MAETYHVFCGDRRQFWAVEQLRARGCVAIPHGVPGLESWPLPDRLSGHVLLPFPSFQGEYLRGREALSIAAVVERLEPTAKVYGALFGTQRAAFERTGASVFDLYGGEPMTTLNAIPTAEGAIRLAIDASSITLHGARSLVLGFGRVGKILAQKLHALSADVTVAARKPADRALAQAMGMRTSGLGEADFLFNTVPAPVLTPQQLEAVNPACLLIELASKPGGLPEEACRARGLHYHFAPGLPGLCAPETAGRLYADCVENLNE